MTTEEFLKILEQNKGLMSAERYEKTKTAAASLPPLLQKTMVEELQQARTRLNQVHNAEQAIATVFESETARLEAKKEELKAHIALNKKQ